MIKRTTFSYVYFLSRVFFIGFGFSFLFNISGKDSWISFLIGNVLSLIIIALIIKEKKKYKERSILKEEKHFFIKLLWIIFSILVAIEILFIFQTLASNFFLVESPHWFIILPALLLVFRICKNGWTTIGRVGSILMYLSLFMVILAFLGLMNYVELENFLPVMTTSVSKIIQSSLYYVAYSTAPILFLILIPDTDDNLIKYYFFANLTILIMGIIIIGILGPDLINIYRYPEYMVLKVIKLLDFIEKVENIFAIATLLDLFMVLSISMNTVKINLPVKGKNIYFVLTLLFIFSVSLFFGKFYDLALQLYYYLPVILLIFIATILTVFCLSLKKKS